MRPPASEFRQVEQLITAGGLNDCEISRETGVPRRTVRDWRTQPAKWDRERRAGTCDGAHDFSVLPAEVYCYLLGMYLGDGCISRSRRTWMLRITCDTQYPGIIERCREAIDIFDARATRRRLDEAERNVRRRLSLLESLAMPVSATRPRPQAPKAHQVGAVATEPR